MKARLQKIWSRLAGKTPVDFDPYEQVRLNTGEYASRSTVEMTMRELRALVKSNPDIHHDIVNVCFGGLHFMWKQPNGTREKLDHLLMMDHELQTDICAIIISATASEDGKLVLVDPIAS